MPDGKDMIARPVVTSDSGDEIGRVKEVIVHRSRNCVVGFLVRRASWLRGAKAVPFENVTSFDKSAVLVAAADSVVGLDEIHDATRILGQKPLIGSLVISNNGHKIGVVDDFSFNENTGELVEINVVTDFDSDTTSNPALSLNDDVFLGRDFVVVNELVVDRLLFHATKKPMDETSEHLVMNEETLAHMALKVQPRVQATTQIAPVFAVKPVDPSQLSITEDGTSLLIRFNTIDIPDDMCIAGFRDQIFRFLAEHQDCTSLSFDVAKIKLLPSGLLGLMASLRKKVGNVEILNPSPEGREALKILGFDKYMTVRDVSE